MTLSIFTLTAHTEEYTDVIYTSFDMPTMEDVNQDDNRGATIILNRYDVELPQEEVLELAGVDADELEFMTIEDIANDYIEEDILMDYINDNSIEGEESVFEEFDRLNKKSDELINEVMAELARRLNRNYFNKYDFINGMSTRIANHTHNPSRGKCDVNVMIAEKDATAKKFAYAAQDLVFNHTNTVDEIVEAILNITN